MKGWTEGEKRKSEPREKRVRKLFFFTLDEGMRDRKKRKGG